MMPDPLGLIPIAARTAPPMAGGGAGAAGGPAFKDVLMEHIGEVNRLQQEAQTAIEDLKAGRRTDVSSVMMAHKKAAVAFQMLVQVHNKMIAAFEEIKQMRV